MNEGASLEIQAVKKYYRKFLAVDDVSLSVKRGEFLTILGPSGSGKTSLLKLIAGFEEIDSGRLFLNEQDISNMKPYQRNIGMLFQNYALFPHMTVFENIAYPLKNRNFSKSEITKKVNGILSLVQLEAFSARLPKQLSGGQQQRVALARALVFDPPLLLLDEPLAALDKNLRKQMQFEIKHIQQKVGITTISVTHDQEEALTMSDRICVMNQGRIAQVDTPEELYRYPVSRFVAEFIGETNLLEGTVIQASGGVGNVKLSKGHIISAPLNPKLQLESWVNRNAYLAIRPENVGLAKGGVNFETTVNGIVEEAIFVGDSVHAKVMTEDGYKIKMKVPSNVSGELRIGKPIRIGWNNRDSVLVPASEASAAGVA